MYNEKSGALDDEDDNDVDLASQAYQIWKNATDANPDLQRIIPNLSDIIYSTKQTNDSINNGVITYVRTHSGFDLLSWYDSKGDIISQSQKKILQAMTCSINEPPLEPLENHFDLVNKAVENVKDENTYVGGILGNRFSTKYRIVTLLENYYARPATIFFTEDSRQMLKYAIDDIYNYPFFESTKFILGRMLRTSSSDDIVEYVLEMRKNGNLCHIDEDTNTAKEPKIICSMGLRNE